MKIALYKIKFFACLFLFSAWNISFCFADKQLQSSDFQYLGAFRVPKGTIGTSSLSGDPYVNAQYQPITFNPLRNSIFIGSYPNDKKTAEISIPQIVNPQDANFDINQLNTATVLQNPTDLTNGHINDLAANGSALTDEAMGEPGGLFVYKNKLLGSAWSYYDASGMNGWRSHFTANLSDWTNSGTGFSGMYNVGVNLRDSTAANGGFVGGYMTEVPQHWKATLGYPVLTGRTGGPIVSRSSYGPSLWGFNPDSFVLGTTTPATSLVTYTTEHHTIGDYDDTPSLMYNRSTGIRGVVFPAGSSSILFFGNHGLGIQSDAQGIPLSNSDTCTGAGTSNKNEAKTNTWLLTNSASGWQCGYIFLSASDIVGGKSCCFDPANTSMGLHSYSYVVGSGQSCYGLGTSDVSFARTNAWLKVNSPAGYNCNGQTTTADAIAAGDGCCFVGTGETSHGGGAYPSVYQIWQYDVNDLLKVKNRTINPNTGQAYKPWDIIPTVWNFDLPFASSTKAKQIIGAGYDASTQRIYIGQAFGDGNYALIHVFQLNLPSVLNYSSTNFINIISAWLKLDVNLDLNFDDIVNTKDLGIMMSKWN